MRPPAPPPPTDPFDRVLARWAREMRAVTMEPDLPDRVVRAIRSRPRVVPRRRGLPAWVAVAAGVLLALGVGSSPSTLRSASTLGANPEPLAPPACAPAPPAVPSAEGIVPLEPGTPDTKTARSP